MNPELLLAHFDRISDAPDAMSHIRSFILDLAVRGKLIEQDSKDEPAPELLKRIQAEKLRFMRDRKISKAGPAPQIGAGELPFFAPSGWSWARLADISCRIHYGFTASANQSRKDVRLLRITDIQNNSVDWSSVPGCEISEREVEQYRLQVGDILIARTGGTIGKTFLVSQVPVVAVFASYLIRVQKSPEFYDRYLKLFLESPVYWKQLRDGARGGGQPNVNGQTLGKMVVAVPPIAEQNRIVGKVDELLGLCDRLEAAKGAQQTQRDRLAAASHYYINNSSSGEDFRAHAAFFLNHLACITTSSAHLKQLRQTILDIAIRGQIVPQDSKDEPASELLRRIGVEKTRLHRSGVSQRLLPISPVAANETLAAIPQSWKWVRISDLLLGDSQNGYSKKPDDSLDGVPILRISAGTVRNDGIVAEEEHKLTGGISAKERDQYELQPGDLLACRFNGNRSFVGRISMYLGYLGIKPIYPDKLIRLRLLPGLVLPKLVRYFAESSVVRRDIESYCATTVGNWGISASNLKDVKIPLPPIAEQIRIVAKVDDLMTLCDHLEKQLSHTQTESGHLLESVLYRALNDASERSAEATPLAIRDVDTTVSAI